MSDNIEYKPFGQLLKKVADNRGKTCPTASSGIPLIATNCIKNENLYPVFEKVRYVSQDIFDHWFRGHPEPGDMIFVTKGTPGRVCWVPNPLNFCIAQDMVAIRADEKKIYPKYLFAALRSPNIQGEIENLHVGSLIPHFKKGDFNDLKIPILDLSIQRYIGDLYMTLSLKIDLLHRQNKTLEALAETLFKQWFVEEVEEGWETKTLEDLIIFDPRERVSNDTEYTFFDMKCLSDSTMAISDGIKRIVNSGSSFRNGDTLLAKITPCLENGKTGFVMNLEEDELARGSTEFIVMRAKEGVSPYFVYCMARYSDFRNTAILSMTGTSGRQRVQTAVLKDYEIKYSKDTIKNFHNTCHPYFKKIRKNQIQIRTLTRLRDTLLPKLMSGEVRVKDAEKKAII